MIVVNFTGLRRFYWLPSLGRQFDSWGLWYIECRWLGVEVVLYSREMATVFIRRLNAYNAELAKDLP